MRTTVKDGQSMGHLKIVRMFGTLCLSTTERVRVQWSLFVNKGSSSVLLNTLVQTGTEFIFYKVISSRAPGPDPLKGSYPFRQQALRTVDVSG